MERLTIDTNILFCDIAQCREMPGGEFCKDGYCDQRRVYERLREYERCGTIDNLATLAKARDEGRVVVLPCKVGDTVWTNVAMSGWYFRDKDKPYAAKVVFVGLNHSEEMGGGLLNIVYGKHDHMMQFRFSDFGKIVFLTRAEAEAALKGVSNGEN